MKRYCSRLRTYQSYLSSESFPRLRCIGGHVEDGTGNNSLFGFGLSNLMLGGIIPFSSARTHLIRLVRSDDP